MRYIGMQMMGAAALVLWTGVPARADDAADIKEITTRVESLAPALPAGDAAAGQEDREAIGIMIAAENGTRGGAAFTERRASELAEAEHNG